MEKLIVSLEVPLSKEALQEELNEGFPVEKHISEAVEHKWHEGWHYIEDCVVPSIGVA